MSISFPRLARLGRILRDGLLQIVYPSACFGCGNVVCDSTGIPDSDAILTQCCRTCFELLTKQAGERCPRCASAIGPHALTDKGCAICRKERFRFDSALRLGAYDGLLRDIVLRMKHNSGETLALWMGSLWATCQNREWETVRADLIVPVPLHWWRRLRRGYNQSEALARGLAERLRMPCIPAALRRIRATPPQSKQSSKERRENVKGAFRASAKGPLRGRTVLLVDDVMTTGATLSEAAKALKAVGAARVVAAALARAGQ